MRGKLDEFDGNVLEQGLGPELHGEVCGGDQKKQSWEKEGVVTWDTGLARQIGRVVYRLRETGQSVFGTFMACAGQAAKSSFRRSRLEITL